MAKIIAVANQKGGVGKTTTVAALGACAADRGLRVLMVDTDPQASLTDALGCEPASSLYEAVLAYTRGEDLPKFKIISLPGGEELIPGGLDLAAAEMALLNADSREYVFREILAPLSEGYDLILLDCPPSLSILTLADLVAADEVLIPIIPEYLATAGLVRIGETVGRVRRRLNRKLAITGVLPTRVKARTLHAQDTLAQIEMWAKQAGVPVFRGVPDTIKAAEASGAGVSLMLYPGGESAADAYKELADAILPEVPSHV